jgi:hypothetical protein
MKLEDYFRIKGTYELIDGVYNVDGHVILNRDCGKLPINFSIVTGHFSCSQNKLKSLEGCPISVGGNFYCYNNKLTSLECSPIYVGGDFCCDDNKLSSLEDCPKYIGGTFLCDENLQRTLEYRQYLIMRKLRQ